MHRPLGAIERYIWSGEQRSPLNGTVVADVEGSTTRPALQAALNAVQQRHPLLRVAVTDTRPRRLLSSHEVGPIPLQLTNADSDDTWRQVAADQLRRPFTRSDHPLVRCDVVTRDNGFHLIIGGSHLIGDGLSAMRLLVEVLEYLGTPQRTVEPLPELPPLEQLIPATIAAELRQSPPPPALAPQAVIAGREAMARSPAGVTQITCWQLPSHLVSALLARCRQERVTVQNGICALLVRALVDMDGHAEQPRRLQVPVSLRDRLARDVAGHYGMFITLVGLELALESVQSPWELARLGQQLLAAQLQDTPVFAALMQIRAISEPLDDDQFLAVFGGRQQAPWDLSVNNLGRVTAPDRFGSLRVRNFWGPILNVGGFETVFGIQSFGGCMSIAISNGDAERAAALRDAFLGQLQQQLN